MLDRLTLAVLIALVFRLDVVVVPLTLSPPLATFSPPFVILCPPFTLMVDAFRVEGIPTPPGGYGELLIVVRLILFVLI
jgi:hypothetical protein